MVSSAQNSVLEHTIAAWLRSIIPKIIHPMSGAIFAKSTFISQKAGFQRGSLVLACISALELARIKHSELKTASKQFSLITMAKVRACTVTLLFAFTLKFAIAVDILSKQPYWKSITKIVIEVTIWLKT